LQGKILKFSEYSRENVPLRKEALFAYLLAESDLELLCNDAGEVFLFETKLFISC
jgi:hypothetical protein